MENVWLYLRKSRDEENDPLILAKHRSELLRLAAHDGVPIAEENVLAEIGSADEIESRPVFKRLLALWERLPRAAGGVIYSTEVARLTRGLQSQQGRVQDALARAAIRHRTRSRWYDLRVPDDCTAWELEGFIARMESRQFKARVMAAWEEMLRAGRIRGAQRAFGYRWSKDARNLLPVEPDFGILCQCCREALTVSVKQLARTYGVPEIALGRALRNPLICGYPARRYGPKDPEKPTRSHYRLRPPEEWDWPEAQNTDYPHACTRAEWDLLQQALTGRRARLGLTDGENGWCRNVVRFPQHPGPCHLASVSTTRANGRTYLTYERRVGNEKALYVARAVVHDRAEAALEALFGQPGLRAALERWEDVPAREGGADSAELIRQRLVVLRRRYQEAVDAQYDAEGADLRRALSDRRQRLEGELTALQAGLEAIPAGPRPDHRFRELLTELPELSRHFRAAWALMQGEERRQLVEAVLREIQVTVTPRPRAFDREVTALLYHDWVPGERDW